MSELGNMVKVAVEMRRAERALLGGDHSFWSLICQSRDMILIVDAHATTCHINQEGARMMCASEKEMVGSSVMKAFHSDDVTKVTNAIASCVSAPGRPFRVQLRGRARGRDYLCLEGEALSTDGRTVIFYLVDVGAQSVSNPGAMDNVLWRDLSPESRELRQRDLTREITFRLISRMLVDRMSDSEAAVAQNRFRTLGGLANARPGAEEDLEATMTASQHEEGDVMSQLIDRLASRIDLMEIDGDARKVERANRRFYGPE
jgi:hypothetical protein